MRRVVVLLTTVMLIAASGTSQAHMMTMPAPPSRTAAPGSFVIDGQYFDATLSGLRRYMESLRTRDPQLYSQLDPKLAQLESRQNTALVVLGLGIGVGLASTIYAFAGRKSCAEPQVGDANFAAEMNTWGQCNDDNMRFSSTFILLGLGAAMAGGFGAFAVSPSRSDLLEIVNQHNRLSREQLHWQIGYDPNHQTAFGRLKLAF
jgi:hypothetical protein